MAIRRASPAYGLPVVPDSVPDFAGPLAGILAGLDWAAANALQIEWMVSVPGDCPFLPADLVSRLHALRVAQDKTARLRTIRRLASSSRRPVAGKLARKSAARADRRRPAQDRSMDRASRRCPGGVAGQAGRSILQREHAGRCGAGRQARVDPPAYVKVSHQIRIRQNSRPCRPARSRDVFVNSAKPSVSVSDDNKPGAFARIFLHFDSAVALRFANTRTYSRRSFFFL